jgi:hypothetical protein
MPYLISAQLASVISKIVPVSDGLPTEDLGDRVRRVLIGRNRLPSPCAGTRPPTVDVTSIAR